MLPESAVNLPAGHDSHVSCLRAAPKEPGKQAKHAVSPLAFMKVPATQSVHALWPSSGCTVPRPHSVGSVAPVEQNDPDGHATQSSSLVIEMPSAVIVLFWWRPDGHGSAADDPASQYEPATHSKHAVSPGPCWYLPAAHLAHVPWLALGCTEPGEHSV